MIGPERWDTDARYRRDAWTAVCVAAASVFLFVVDSGLVALTLPKIEAEYPGVARSTLGWMAVGFLVAMASMLLVGGRLGDRRGRKRFYLLGVLVFSCSAGLTALAPNVPLIIAARVLQGLGAGFLTSGALALVLPMFPVAKQPRMMGTWGAVGSLAGWATPAFGPFIVDLNWRLAFGLIVPFGLAVYWVGRRVLDESTADDTSGRTDRPSYYLGPTALALIVLVRSQGPKWGWGTLRTLLPAAVGFALFAVFIHRCRTADTPLLDLGLFRHRIYVANVLAGACQQIGFFAWYVTGPLIMHNLWGWSTRDSGLALALGQVMASFGSPLGGLLVERIGHRSATIVGAVFTGLSMVWQVATLTPESRFWFSYLPAALMFGFAGAICGTVCSGAALTALPTTMLGVGNSVQQLIRRVGGAVGIALAVALLGESTGTALLAGARRVWLLVALVHLAMVVPLLAIRREGGRGDADGARASDLRPTGPVAPTAP